MLIAFANFTHGSKYLMFHLSFLYCAHKKILVATNYSKNFFSKCLRYDFSCTSHVDTDFKQKLNLPVGTLWCIPVKY